MLEVIFILNVACVHRAKKKTKLETTTNEGARRKKINKIEMHTHARARE